MSYVAEPTLQIGSTAVPLKAVGGTIPTLVGVADLRIRWGRSSLLEQPTPATAAFTVRDTADGAPFARRRDLIGQPVWLGWSGSDASAVTLFHGRITDVAVIRRGRGGYEVALSASSKELDAANHTLPEGTVWPQETIAQRLERIQAAGTRPIFAQDAQFPDATGLTAAAADVGGRDLLSLLRELYTSVTAAPAYYDPDRDGYTWSIRPSYVYSPATGQSRSARLALEPSRGGRYIAAPLLDGIAIDAADVEFDGALEQPLDTRLTMVEVKFTDAAGDEQSVALAVPGVADLEGTIGRRSLSIASALTVPADALKLAALWTTLAAGEAAHPRLGPLIWSTRRTPFPTSFHALTLLRCVEGWRHIFFNGAWPTLLGTRPLFGIVGGTVSYAGGEWTAEFTPAAISVESATRPLTPRVAASAASVRLADVDPAVTLADLAFVDVGAGYTDATQPL